MVKEQGSGATGPGLCLWTTVERWTSHLTLPSLSLVVYKMEIMLSPAPQRIAMRIEGNIYKALAQGLTHNIIKL